MLKIAAKETAMLKIAAKETAMLKIAAKETAMLKIAAKETAMLKTNFNNSIFVLKVTKSLLACPHKAFREAFKEA
jgi:hypothetical protein